MRLPPLIPVPRDQAMPMSLQQELMLRFIERVGANNPASYNIFKCIELTGPLDIKSLERVLNEVIRRHEALRSSFSTIDGQTKLIFAETRNLKLPVVDLECVPTPEQDAHAFNLAVEEVQIPFDLSRDPLLRVVLLRLGELKHVLVLTTHHLISDGWSTRILLREIIEIYKAFINKQPSPLPELAVQYADFAYWQRQWAREESQGELLAYWKSKLSGLPSMNLPFDHPPPDAPSFRGGHQPIVIESAVASALIAFSQREGVTLFMTLLAAFKLLLHGYTGQDDVVVGTPVLNRTKIETEPLIGLFTNNFLLRSDLGGDPTFRELLKRVRNTTLEAYDNQDVPLGLIMQALDISWIQIMFALAVAVRQKERDSLQVPPLTVDFIGIDPSQTTAKGLSRRDLSLYMFEALDEIRGTVEYSADRFEANTIALMISDFKKLLEQVMAQPDQPLSTLTRVLEYSAAPVDVQPAK